MLHDILATEISPELVPAGADGAIQSTESIVGPYALQDFNLFYTTRYGFAPSKIAYLAWHAWHDADAGAWPANIPGRRPARLRPRRDQELAAGVPDALLRAEPVQALGPAERPEDLVGRLACRRAATGARRRIRHAAVWLAELEANVPDKE